MAQPESNLQNLQEELEQIATWLSEEGLPPDSPRETQLCLLWRSFQSTRSHLSSVSLDLDTQRSKHLAEMAEVRKSLEQIRIFTEHKDALAQEIQDENDQLKEQLRQLISLQDSQISEVAKMLYQQGLTELIHSSPSEQVAYLLVERASLLETSEAPDKLTGDGNSTGLLETETQVLKTAAPQADSRHLAGQVSSVLKECSRLERDLEEGSRRLAMAHSEIRHLTDELESAHLTQRAYEPELQAAQHEVQQLRQEVKKLKKYEMAELRKTKELNDRLDLEIRALRNRIRSLDAEKSSLQQTVVSQQETVMRLESALTEQRSELQRLAEQIEASQADELAEESPTGFWMHSKTQLDNQPHQKEWGQKEAMSQHCGETRCQHKDSFASEEMLEKQLKLMKNKESSQKKTSSSYQEAVNNLLASQDKCETLKKEICETLRWLDRERSKYHEMREKHKAKLCRTKQKFEEEIAWRDEKMGNLERELSLCSHSLQKEKELTRSITVENDKLLDERRKLLQQLNEEEHNRKDSRLTASLSKCRMDFLEMENRKLEKKVLHVSSQLAVLERRLQNRESADPAEELKVSTNMQSFPPLSVPTLSAAVNKPEEIAGDTHVTLAPPIFLSRPAEMGYLNLTPSRNHSDVSAPSVLISGSGGTCC